MNIKYIATVLTILLLASSIPAAVYTWDNGGSTDRFSNIGNWDPTAPIGGPQSGDTGTVGGSYRVEVGTSTELTTGAAITFSDSSTLERNNTSLANMSGTFIFQNISSMYFSDLRLLSGGTLNWNSTGTFSNAPGLSPGEMFDNEAGSTVNMSAGLWTLDGGTTDAIDINGTFNMSGGKMEIADRMRIDGTFNLSGGELFVADEYITGTLDFLGTDGTFYHAGHDFSFGGRTDGNLKIDGIAQSNLTGFNVENVNVGGIDYTKFTVVPEPATIGMLALGAVISFLIRKR